MLILKINYLMLFESLLVSTKCRGRECKKPHIHGIKTVKKNIRLNYRCRLEKR